MWNMHSCERDPRGKELAMSQDEQQGGMCVCASVLQSSLSLLPLP